jgi:hypothetical protein
MNIVRQLDAKEKGLTLRQIQEIESLMEKSNDHKYPVKNTCKKAVGEYFATMEDKVNLLKYLSTHPTMPYNSKKSVNESLGYITTYDKKGFNYGLINAVAIYFFPGVRRLVFYKRIPIALTFLYFWMHWGYNYGRDIAFVSSRNIIENWERDMGFRNFQTGL